MAKLPKVKVGDRLKFNRDWSNGRIFGHKKVKRDQEGTVTKLYYNGFWKIVHHMDVRLSDGTVLKEVPAKYLTTV